MYVISIEIHGSKDMETISKRFIKCLCKKNIGSKNLKYKEISNYYWPLAIVTDTYVIMPLKCLIWFFKSKYRFSLKFTLSKSAGKFSAYFFLCLFVIFFLCSAHRFYLLAASKKWRWKSKVIIDWICLRNPGKPLAMYMLSMNMF